MKGPKGRSRGKLPPTIEIEVAGEEVSFARTDERKTARALHGLARALVANMVRGVTQGFVRELEIQGVGYRAEVAGKKLKLALGFSHPVVVAMPDGLTVSVEGVNKIKIEGIDREQVGQFAAELRELRPPEPYKGKGIRYVDERVRRKVGKAGAAPRRREPGGREAMKAKIGSARKASWTARRVRVARKRSDERSRASHRLPQREAHLRAARRSGERAARSAASRRARRPSSEGLASTGNVEAAKRVGSAIAQLAREKKIEKVVFNRNGFLYHGRVKAVADAAREAGLQF